MRGRAEMEDQSHGRAAMSPSKVGSAARSTGAMPVVRERVCVCVSACVRAGVLVCARTHQHIHLCACPGVCVPQTDNGARETLLSKRVPCNLLADVSVISWKDASGLFVCARTRTHACVYVCVCVCVCVCVSVHRAPRTAP